MRAAASLSVHFILSLGHFNPVAGVYPMPCLRLTRLFRLFHQNQIFLQVGKRTLSILAPADLDELLDIGDFGRHLDGDVDSTSDGNSGS